MNCADRDATRRALSKPAAFVVLCKGLALKETLTAARLRELLHYDPETGVFTWLKVRAPHKVGSVAGTRSKPGYIYITINQRSYAAHRLVWLYVHGVFPKHQIDHRDGDQGNNRIVNLREATNSQNHQNVTASRNGSSGGYLGVTYDRARGKWQAQIKQEGKYRFLGRHATPEAAFIAYCEAKATFHTFNPNVRIGRTQEAAHG